MRRPWDKPPSDFPPSWVVIGLTCAVIYVVVWIAFIAGSLA